MTGALTMTAASVMLSLPEFTQHEFNLCICNAALTKAV